MDFIGVFVTIPNNNGIDKLFFFFFHNVCHLLKCIQDDKKQNTPGQNEKQNREIKKTSERDQLIYVLHTKFHKYLTASLFSFFGLFVLYVISLFFYSVFRFGVDVPCLFLSALLSMFNRLFLLFYHRNSSQFYEN